MQANLQENEGDSPQAGEKCSNGQGLFWGRQARKQVGHTGIEWPRATFLKT